MKEGLCLGPIEHPKAIISTGKRESEWVRERSNQTGPWRHRFVMILPALGNVLTSVDGKFSIMNDAPEHIVDRKPDKHLNRIHGWEG